MNFDIDSVKNKILEQTLKERKEIQEIYQNSCKKAKTITHIKRLVFTISLVGLIFLLHAIWHYSIPAAVIIFAVISICCIPFIVMFLTGDRESFYDRSLDNILRKDKVYHTIENQILAIRDQIVKETMSQYLIYLKDKIGRYVLGKNYFSFVESLGNQNNEVNERAKKIIQEIESTFAKSKFLLFKDLNIYDNIYFSFSFSYEGKSIWGTKVYTTITLDDSDIKNDTISYKSMGMFL